MKKICVIIFFLLSFVLAKGWAQAQSVGLRIPDSTIVQGATVDIPLYVDSTLTGRQVYSYSFQLSYDAYYLQPVSVITSGTISETLGNPVVNTSVSGILSFAAAGTLPMAGAGKLIVTRWKLKSYGWAGLGFTDLKHNYLNEGMPAVTLKNGQIYIQQAPTITIYPDNMVIAKGDQLQMNAYGGTPPYTWSVTDNDLAGIDQNGLLTAKSAGLEKVVAVDVSGIRDTTRNLEIRPLKLSIPPDLMQWEGKTIDVPMLTTDLTGLNISSGIFQLGYDPSVLSPVGIIQAGTMLESYQVFMKNSQQVVSVSFAGSTALTGSGTLIYVRFNVLLSSNGYSYLTLDKAIMNENLMPALSNGYFSKRNFNNISFYPSSGSLMIGESINLNLYGQPIPPWKWVINDPSVASINQSGILTGLKQGKVIVSIIDSVGATAKSDYFYVFDTRILIPDTSICHYDRTLYYPLNLAVLPHDSIFSMEGQLSYDSTKLSYTGIEMAGTSTQNWVWAANEKDGMISMASSGTKALQRSGTLLKLKFIPKEGFGSGSWAGINIVKFDFNEGLPNVLVQQNGNVSGINGNTGFAVINTSTGNGFCEGDTILFASSVQYGGSQPVYQWLKNGNPIPAATADKYRTSLVSNGDNITCKVISNDPCVIDSVIYSNTITLTVNPKPLASTGISGKISVKGGDTNVTYSVPVIPYANFYMWYLSKGVMGYSSTNSITLQFANTITTALIKVQGINGCGAGPLDSLAITVIPNTGFSQIETDKPLMYPNPIDNELHIVLNNSIVNNILIDVYDATGRMLKVEKVQSINEIILNFSGYSKGIYLIRVSANEESEYYKLIKK